MYWIYYLALAYYIIGILYYIYVTINKKKLRDSYIESVQFASLLDTSTL